VIGDSNAGILDRDSRAAALSALAIPRAACRAALRFGWCASIEQFLGCTVPAVPPARARGELRSAAGNTR
jgi:hypothetical protein